MRPPKTSVPEMPHPGEHHREARSISRSNHLVVADTLRHRSGERGMPAMLSYSVKMISCPTINAVESIATPSLVSFGSHSWNF